MIARSHPLGPISTPIASTTTTNKRERADAGGDGAYAMESFRPDIVPKPSSFSCYGENRLVKIAPGDAVSRHTGVVSTRVCSVAARALFYHPDVTLSHG